MVTAREGVSLKLSTFSTPKFKFFAFLSSCTRGCNPKLNYASYKGPTKRCVCFFFRRFFFLLLGKNIVCLCKEALFKRPDIIKTFQTSVCVKEIFPRKKKSVKKQSGWKINAEFWAEGVKNRVCSKDMHGNFFQYFYFFFGEKNTQPCSSDFFGIFFS